MIRLLLFVCLLTGLPNCTGMEVPAELRGEKTPASVSEVSGPVSGTLQIYFPYVGQGDAALVISPAGKTLLIDAGPPGSGTAYLLPLLDQLKIKKLDALMISHYDLDHWGGVPELLKGPDGKWGTGDEIEVDMIWDRGGEPWDPNPRWESFRQDIEEQNISRHAVSAGDFLPWDEQVKLNCLAVNGSVAMKDGSIRSIDLTPVTYTGQENASSIGLKIEFGEFSYLTAGDLTGGGSLNGFLTPDVESLLGIASGLVKVVHADHHGSLSSSNEDFIHLTSPEAVMIQAGIDNPYHHPAQAVVTRWKNAGTLVYSTEGGTSFLLTSEGKDFEMNGFAWK